MAVKTLDEKIYMKASRYRKWHNRNKLLLEKESELRKSILKLLNLSEGEIFVRKFKDVTVRVRWDRNKLGDEQAVVNLLREHGFHDGYKTVVVPDWDKIKELRELHPGLDVGLKALEAQYGVHPVLTIR